MAQAAEIARCLPGTRACAPSSGATRSGATGHGNLDVWIAPLVQGAGVGGALLSSVARVERGYVTGIDSLLDKAAVLNTLPRPIAAVGDGINDLPMLLGADVGIAFAGSHPAPSELAQAAGYVAWDESACDASGKPDDEWKALKPECNIRCKKSREVPSYGMRGASWDFLNGDGISVMTADRRPQSSSGDSAGRSF